MTTPTEKNILKELKELNWKLGFIVKTSGWSEQRHNIWYLHENGLTNQQIAQLLDKEINYIAKEISLWKRKHIEK